MKDLDKQSLNFTSKISMNANPFLASAKSVEEKLDNIQKLLITTGVQVDQLGGSFEKSFSKASHAASGLVSIVSSIPGVIMGAIASLTGLAAPVFAVDNFLGVLNQNLNNTKGTLDRYRTYVDQSQIDAKRGDMGFGADLMDRYAVAQHFTQGMDYKDKYGPGMEQKLKDFSISSLETSLSMGVDKADSSKMLIDMHRNLKLATDEMPAFTKGLTDIARQSKLSGSSILGLIDKAAQLGGTLKLTGKEALDFTYATVQAGSILASAGLGADTQNKISSFQQTASIGDFIRDQMAGINQNDNDLIRTEKYAAQAKRISDMSGGNLLQMGMVGQTLMPGFNVAEISRLAGLAGMSGEQIKKAGEKPKTNFEIQQEAFTKGLEEAGPRFVTSANIAHDAVGFFQATVDQNFKGAVNDFKDWVTEAKAWITSFMKQLKEWFPNGISLKEAIVGAISLALAPSVIKGLFGAVAGAIGSEIVLGVAAFLGGLSIGTFINNYLKASGYQKQVDEFWDGVLYGFTWNMQNIVKPIGSAIGKFFSFIGDYIWEGITKLVPQGAKDWIKAKWGEVKQGAADWGAEGWGVFKRDAGKALGMTAKDIATTGGDLVDRGVKALMPHGDQSVDKRLSAFAQKEGFTITSGKGEEHNVGSKHNIGQAIDVSLKGKTEEEKARIKQDALAEGFILRDESVRPKGQKVWDGAHYHIETKDAAKITKPAIEPRESITTKTTNSRGKETHIEVIEEGNTYLARIANNTEATIKGLADLVNNFAEWKVPMMNPQYSNPYSPVNPFEVKR